MWKKIDEKKGSIRRISCVMIWANNVYPGLSCTFYFKLQFRHLLNSPSWFKRIPSDFYATYCVHHLLILRHPHPSISTDSMKNLTFWPLYETPCNLWPKIQTDWLLQFVKLFETTGSVPFTWGPFKVALGATHWIKQKAKSN